MKKEVTVVEAKKKVVIVIATRCIGWQEFLDRPIGAGLQKTYNQIGEIHMDYEVASNNKEGLSKVYNKYLKDPKFADDILLFVHDDVEINDLFLVEKLQNSPYEVTGLAGSKSFDLSKDPAWHLMTERSNMVGEVAHSKDGNVWTTAFGPTNSRAILLDGLFLAVDVEAITKKGAYFDEDFDFHHYDLAFGMVCHEKKVKCGVLPINVVHHGLGDSMLTEDWRHSAKKFSEKYN